MARKIVVLTTLGEKVGRAKQENSLKILMDPIQQKMADIPVSLLDQRDYLDNFLQQEELKENHLYVMENLNFRPDENGYVEPFVDQEEMAALKKLKEQEQKEDFDTSGDGKKDAKKMSAAEKKKAEADKANLEESVNSEDRRKQMEKDLAIIQRADEARQKRDVDEHFDQNTTYSYLNQLGRQFGSIYVNDAPLACLTSSNSVAEIKC